MTRPPKDIAASVKQRLLNHARLSGEDFNTLLVRFANERFLYRLSRSRYASEMVLKGAMLFTLWRPTPHRPTRDLDLLGFGDPSPESVAQRVREVLATEVEDDGLIFDAASVKAGRIREDQDYEGVRVTLAARLGKARIDLQIDIGYGDALTDNADKVEYPSLLGFPPPVVRAYSRETVVAEKLHAMVELGMANSRMKDFYDLLILSREFAFDWAKVTTAIQATFQRRGTPVPSTPPLAMTDEFGSDAAKQTQWTAFLRRLSLTDAPSSFAKVIASIRTFLAAPLCEPSRPVRPGATWRPGGPWQ